MRKVADFVRRNPARVYGVTVAVLALVAFFLPATPVALILGVVGAVLGIGGAEAVQRTENRKTNEAFAADPLPDMSRIEVADDAEGLPA
jgi:xanthosine utilization system XapX-like protein